jgi:hypothetical protein
MAISQRPCALCKGPVSQSVLPVLTGNEYAFHVTLSNVPVMICSEGHKRLLNSNFVMDLMDTLARPETAGLRVGAKQGIFRKWFRCTKCSSEIPAEQTAIAEYKANVRLSDMTDPLIVTMGVPVMRCGACGTEQLPDESGLMQLFKALTHAFRSADVRPQ